MLNFSKTQKILINKKNDVCQFIRHFLFHLLRKHLKTDPLKIAWGVFWWGTIYFQAFLHFSKCRKHLKISFHKPTY